MLILTGCGKDPEQGGNNFSLPDAACEIRDVCTYVNVPGYQCEATRWNTDSGNGTALPASFFGGAPCVITKDDWQTDPKCDPSQTCTGWGVSGNTVSCCDSVQGPGPASVMN
jgi:hypothetical protein